MADSIFVYGTLAPGRPNAHVLESIGGRWQAASVTGYLREAGWGAAMGYPGIDLDMNGKAVEGFLFISDALMDHWEMLDSFEGDEYKRVQTTATLPDGRTVNTWIYQLR